MKTCFKCGSEKPLTEFYRHPKMSDGRLGKCKECTKRDVQKNREKRHEYYVEFDRARGMLPHRVAARKEYSQTPAGKVAIARARRKQTHLHPDKYLAHTMVGNAIRDGRLLRKPCERCGSNQLIHAHHERYDRPLDVTWLCRSCHVQRHREMRTQGIKP